MQTNSRNHAHSCALSFSIGILALAMLSDFASAQVFSTPQISLDWLTQQTGSTLDPDTGSVLCESPWNGAWMFSGVASFDFSESFGSAQGGCPLVILERMGSFSSSIGFDDSAELSVLYQIAAHTTTEVERVGSAQGLMSGSGCASVQVQEWMFADVLIRFLADFANENAAVTLDAHFMGPIDPLPGSPVLTDHAWSGSGRQVVTLGATLLAPGRYEVRTQVDGSLNSVVALNYVARASAWARIESAAPTNPPPEWDLDNDGTVGLLDACIWSDNPSDTDGSGTIDQADLELIMALARAAGENATDTDMDGVPDQCQNSCIADFNSDQTVDFFDVQAFLTAFSIQDPRVDLNHDGIIDFFDLLAFLDAFAAGC